MNGSEEDCPHINCCRNISLKTVKNALTFARRRSGGSEEQSLLWSSQDQTDRDTEDEAGRDSPEETDRGRARGRARGDSVGSLLSDNETSKSFLEKRKSKKTNK